MTVFVQTVLTRATITLQDPGNTRWPVAELIGYFNDGIRELVTARPDTCSKTTQVTTVAGTRQTLPDEVIALVEVQGNSAAGSKRYVAKVDRAILNASLPTWENSTPSAICLNYVYDQRDPLTYHIYPPSTGVVTLDVVHSYFPPDVASATDSIGPISQQWQNALLNYVLGRAYAKDAEYGGNAQAAAAYMGAFTSAIGAQLQSSTAVAPKS